MMGRGAGGMGLVFRMTTNSHFSGMAGFARTFPELLDNLRKGDIWPGIDHKDKDKDNDRDKDKYRNKDKDITFCIIVILLKGGMEAAVCQPSLNDKATNFHQHSGLYCSQ